MTVLATVRNAERPLPATEISWLIPAHSDRRIRSYLTLLYKEGLIGRKREKLRGGGWGYLYYASAPGFEDEADSGWTEAQQEIFRTAVARARPRWRSGELFTRGQVAQFRREQRRRDDWALGH